MSDEDCREAFYKLGNKIIDLINEECMEHRKEWTVSDADRIAMSALLNAMQASVVSMRCAGCRKETARFLKRRVPELVREALVEAAGRPQTSEHIH